jgi:PAS domain S-box-containing protein
MKNILISSILVVLLFFISYEIYYKPEVTKITNETYEHKANSIKKLFQSQVENKFGKTFALTYLISKDSKLIEALLKKDASLIDYKSLISQVEHFGEYKNLWIQIVDNKGYSFYRSWTKKVGDHAATARIDIADMIKNPRPMRGISTGRFDMTFKTMIPLYNEGQFIGMVEMISKFNSIATELENQNILPIIVLHEKYTKRFIKPFTGLFIDNNYVANLNASKQLMKKVQKNGLKNFLYIEDYLLFEKYLVTTDQIKDVHGEEMGYFIFFFDKDNIDKSAIYNFKTTYNTKIIIALIILVLLLLYLFTKNYAKQLSQKVQEKTNKIQKQQKDIKSLLKIYDRYVIFSKTDPKGIITHASKAFCDISGYTLKELIGKPHNIVRHPDTPQEVFKDMWQTIQSGKLWRGEVKNLKKDGSHYWVDAQIQAEYDENNHHIGYTAIRQNITDTKDIEEIQRDIIFNMGSIGESRSEETGNHVKRVAEFSKLLALKYGINEHDAEMLKLASPMHDIGKVGIPDAILKKRGILTADERKIMDSHVNIGYEMLSGSNRSLLKIAAIVAHEHHEKWDGTGYPRGLKGEEIHIYGRITALVDVFDALGSDRCYKKAWEDEKIFHFFKEQSGKHFDPNLVELFFDNIDEFLAIRDKYKDNFEE